MTRDKRLWLLAFVSCFGSTAMVACHSSSPETSTSAVGVPIDRTRQPLAVGALSALGGTYGAGCTGRSGSWSLRLSGSGTLPHDELSVDVHDTGCVLSATEIVADGTYVLDPPIAMTDAYAPSASAVASGSKKFYVNARLSAAGYASDFAVLLLYSDDPSAAAATVGASYASLSATASSQTVTAPSYTFASGTLDVRVDASNVVTQVTGSASLTDGATTGTSFVVDTGSLGASPTYAEAAAAYAAGTATAIAGASPTVPAAAFGLTGVDLSSTVYRTVIVRRVVSGIAAYETIRVAFTHP